MQILTTLCQVTVDYQGQYGSQYADVRVLVYVVGRMGRLAEVQNAHIQWYHLVPSNQSQHELFSARQRAGHTAAPERQSPCTTLQSLPPRR